MRGTGGVNRAPDAASVFVTDGRIKTGVMTSSSTPRRSGRSPEPPGLNPGVARRSFSWSSAAATGRLARRKTSSVVRGEGTSIGSPSRPGNQMSSSSSSSPDSAPLPPRSILCCLRFFCRAKREPQLRHRHTSSHPAGRRCGRRHPRARSRWASATGVDRRCVHTRRPGSLAGHPIPRHST